MLLASLIESGTLGRLASDPVEVDANLTLLVQVAVIVVLLLVLKPVLFDPMLKLFEERERRTDGAKLHARHVDARSQKAATEYETAVSKGRTAANAERDAIRAEGVKKETEILQQVRKTASASLEEGKKIAAVEAAKAREALKADHATIARELASRVLGREVH